MVPEDLQALLQSGAGCCVALHPDLTIAAVNDECLRATMTRREALVGANIFDAFPEDPDAPDASGVANLRRSLDYVLAEKRPHTMAIQKRAIRGPEAEDGSFEERQWVSVNSPVFNDDGELLYIVLRAQDVTNSMRLKRERQQALGTRTPSLLAEEHASRLLDTAPDAMVVVGTDGRIHLVNIQTEQLFGYTRAELIGESLEMLIPQRSRRGHAGHVTRFFADPDARPMGSGLELFGRRKDGTEIPIEVSLSPLHTELGMTVSAAIRDISERKRLEAATKLMAERLASAVESIEDAFALFDKDDCLVLCNSVYHRLVGDSVPGPLIGRSYREVLEAWSRRIDFDNESESRRFREERLRRSAGETTTFDIRLLDGRSLRVIGRRTAEGGIVKTIWDRTVDERREEELRVARAAAEAGSAAKSEFVSSMSHELRTPLNAILGFAQLLQRDTKEPLSSRHRERAEQIIKGGGHLLRLIDDILDLSRIEAGAISMAPEAVDVLEVLEAVKSTLLLQASSERLNLNVHQFADMPRIVADRTRFAQILMNFGTNAIKYNRTGGSVTFTVSLPSRKRLRVAVSDTGIGIPPEKQSKIFQPFQRAGQEAGPIQGTGIGLVITRRLAALMGGEVGFTSTLGLGSEFWVDMPVHTSGTHSSVPPPGPMQRSRLAHGGERGVVLYVEDHSANVAFMTDLLSSFEGVELLSAGTAELGIELAREHRPAVIIMDINLPTMSGVEALRQLRATSSTKDIPVIALSAAATQQDLQRGLQAGFHRYLTKPVEVNELIGVLEELFSLR